METHTHIGEDVFPFYYALKRFFQYHKRLNVQIAQNHLLTKSILLYIMKKSDERIGADTCIVS